MRKTICLVTNWYPSPENEARGVFFKEQAFAVADEYDFIVFRYQELRRILFGKDSVKKINEEQNTIEYSVIASYSRFLGLIDRIYDYYVKRKGLTFDGIGRYISPLRVKAIKKKLAKLFSKIGRRVDVFYCVDGQTEAFVIQCLAELYNAPYVVSEHAPVPWPGTLISDVNKKAIEKADLFLAISYDKIRQLMLQNIRLPQTFYLGNMVDDEKFIYRPENKGKVKTFIIVAAHSFYKNYDMFVEVMNGLKDIAKKEFRVLIVGYAANKGYSKDVDVFEEEIRQSRFSDYAELIPEVPHNIIVEFYKKADAFVMTSIQEGQPVSAMEAACCGLPIFSTRCGGVDDYVDDQIGKIYSINDVEGMINGLNDFLEGKINFDSVVIRNKIIGLFGKKAFSENFKKAFGRLI